MRKDVLTDKKHQKLLSSLIFDSPLKKWSKNKIVATIALTKIGKLKRTCVYCECHLKSEQLEMNVRN